MQELRDRRKGLPRSVWSQTAASEGIWSVIIGNGLLAQTFAPRFAADPDTLIFASGVSHSMETRAAEFERERTMLLDALDLGARRLIYFGSCGVTSPEAELTPYMRHKR